MSDLEEVYTYIHEDLPGRARMIANEIVDASDALSDFPMRGHVVEEFSDISIRQITVKGFRIIHHVDDNTVHIIAVIHGARDLVALWKREDRHHNS